MTDIGAKLIAAYFGGAGLLLLGFAFLILSAGYQLPFAVASVPLGIVGLAVSGTVAVIPFALGVFFLAVAYGVWKELSWGAWLAIGLSAISLLFVVSIYAALQLVGAVPFVGSLLVTTINPPYTYMALAAVANVLILVYLILRRDRFSP